MVKQIKEYWASLETRERTVLLWGTVVVAFILFYALLWQPWQNALNFMENSVQSMRENSVWMQQRAQDMKFGNSAVSRQPRRGAEQSLLSVIEQTANQADVNGAIQQIVPNQENGEVRVVLEDVDFNQWVRWIDNLYKNYSVNITQINAEKDDEKPNLAEIRLTFIRN